MGRVVEDRLLRNRVGVFRDRFDAAEKLAEFLREYGGREDALILAVPAGGVPVGYVLSKKLDLPLDKKIIFSYGLKATECFVTLPVIESVSKKYDLAYLVLPTEEKGADETAIFKALKRFKFLTVRAEAPLSLSRLYMYLHAADLLLIYKKSPNIVVSSTVALCLGSGCPIVINRSRYTETLGREVFIYRDPWELKSILERILSGKLTVDFETVSRVLEEHSPEKVARRILGSACARLASQTA